MASSSQNIEDPGERWNEFHIEEEEGGVLFDETEVLKDEAPDRRNNKQIGAKWLRDNMANPLDGNSSEHRAEQGDRRSERMEPRITDVVMGNGENYGDGEKIQQLMSGKCGDNKIRGEIEAGNYISNPADGLIVIDNKRRRMQEVNEVGQSTTTLGQNYLIEDAGMDNLNKEGKEVMNKDMDYSEGNYNIVTSPKNGFVAGTQSGARQGL
ncbi:hypothetical protein POM88_024065 [Heracleum sosnowskyi]|uniref:Uncharacterized protein n=1 Tax=Heracleum sosnowskyi TaxID=360622 RepID=A0AAD8IIG1_9APIA|nr:hypothetical protein POM88_024065 [Heracleum sosnowskyi]